MLLDGHVQVTVSKVDHDNDRVWLEWIDPVSGAIIEKEMSLKYFTELVNREPNCKIENPVMN